MAACIIQHLPASLPPCLPPSLLTPVSLPAHTPLPTPSPCPLQPVNDMATALVEAKQVMSGAVKELLAKTGAQH